MRVLGNPIKMSGTPAAPQGPAPKLGEHTEQILLDVLGLTPEAVRALRAAHKSS